MTRRTTTRTTARTAAALAVLGAVALGSATACASGSAVNAGGSAAVSVSPSATSSVVVPVPTTPAAGTQTGIQPGGPNIPAPSSSGSGSGAASATPTGRGQTADGYSVSGTVLTVHFYGGTCEKYGLHADQSASGEVAVTVVVTQGPKAGQMCPAVLTPQTVSTDLGSPLDGRRVVDTTTGKALPLSNPLPSSGTVVTHGPTKPN